MTVIQYTMSRVLEYEGWDVPQVTSIFRFPVKAVLLHYRSAVAKSLSHIHMNSRRNGTYKDHVQKVAALAWLESVWLAEYPKESDRIIEWPETLHDLWAFSGELVFHKEFASVSCSSCSRTYQPADVEVRQWSHGSGLAAHGGRGLLCPGSHSLYVMAEWVS